MNLPDPINPVDPSELDFLPDEAIDATFDDGAPNINEIDRGLKRLESTGGRAALALKQARIYLAQCRKDLRDAKARAYMEAKTIVRHDGKPSTVQEREMYVTEKTSDQQFNLDIAEAALNYAKDLMDERAGLRSSMQTRAKLSLEALQLAGYAGTSAPKWRTERMNG